MIHISIFTTLTYLITTIQGKVLEDLQVDIFKVELMILFTVVHKL